MKRCVALLSCFTFTICAAQAARAEPYVGLSAGVGFDQAMIHGRGNENTNYPSAPDGANPPDAGSLYTDSHLTGLNLQNSPMIGAKVGYWFDQLPALGVEGEFFYNQPNFKRQNVTLSNPGFVNAVGTAAFTEDQLRVHADQYVFAANGLYRYKGWQGFTPYVGGGPAMYVWDIHGTGYSGIIHSLSQPGEDGPRINEHPITWGTNFKAGAEYALTPQWGLGLEYRFNWSAMKIDNFRSISDATADYVGNAVELTMTRHF